MTNGEAGFTRVQAFALVLLRVLIGWHFLYEGIAKLSLPAWSATGFLSQSRGPFAELFRGLAADPSTLERVNAMTMWGLVLIGLGLVVGCLTRLAAASGILMILLIYLCNPPFVGYFYSIPTEGSYLVVNKNLVEAAGLLVVIVTNSGRIAGLDRIIHGLLRGRGRGRTRLATA
jgi:thiosulfate dehydrogenase [quinone] large subunit